MKLKDILSISEETTTSSVASFEKVLGDGDEVVKPIQRSMVKTSMFKYLTTKNCKGCNIIKEYGWSSPNSNSKELTCQYCGTIHKKHS